MVVECLADVEIESQLTRFDLTNAPFQDPEFLHIASEAFQSIQEQVAELPLQDRITLLNEISDLTAFVHHYNRAYEGSYRVIYQDEAVDVLEHNQLLFARARYTPSRQFQYAPSNMESPQIVLCRSIFKRMGKWISKHKKVVLAVAIVAAAVAVAVITGGTGGAPAAKLATAGVGALAATGSKEEESEQTDKLSSGGPTPPPGDPPPKDLPKPISEPLASISFNSDNISHITHPPHTSFTLPTRDQLTGKPSYVPFVDPDGPYRLHSLASERPRSQTFETPGLQLKRGCIGGINGIGNHLEDAYGHAKYFSELAGKHQIQWVHNRSNSPLADVAEVIFANYNGYSAPSKLLIENWAAFHEKHKNDPGAKYLQYCHSQGAAAVRIALEKSSEEIRNRVIVVALAPAMVVPDDLCFRSFNYAVKGDPVPYGQVVLGISSDDEDVRSQARERLNEIQKHLIVLDPHPDDSWPHHDLQNPAFKKVIGDHAHEFTQNDGAFE